MPEATAMDGGLVAIGNFDGVHRGHQAVLAAVLELSKKRSLEPRLLTFDPHPAITLGRTPPPLLTRLPRKLELVARLCPGIEPITVAFTREFANQTPEEFVERVLLERLHARAVMVGANFRFGKGRAGGIADLERLGSQSGFDVVSAPLVGDSHGPWSSTRIRRAIAQGDIEDATQMLGRPHMLSGTVSRGAQRGRQLGFPTCNVADAPEALPPFGVYAVLVDRVADGAAKAVTALGKGVANIGVRPTIGGGDPSRPLIEAHVFDFDGDIYGADLRVHLVERLRAEMRFDGLDALKAQIAKDSERARQALTSWAPDATIGGPWT